MPVFLVFLVLTFAIPVLVLALVLGRTLARFKRTFLWSLVFVCTIGGFWDWLSVRTGVWRYDSAPTVGIWLGGLPIEEFVGFFLLGTGLLVAVNLLILRIRGHV